MLRPPNRCPNCGDLPCEEIRRHDYAPRAGDTPLRYPSFIVHAFPCGTRIEAEFVVKRRLSGHLGSCHWELRTVSGCKHATQAALNKSTSRGVARR